MSIEAQAVSVSRNGKSILNGVSFRLMPGRVTVILGQNGAGKSTLVKLISGEWVPDSGRILWEGRDLRTLESRWLACRRAIVNQQLDLRFAFTVREVVEMGRYPHGDAGGRASENRVDEALGEMDLESMGPQPATSLSGGERQRMLLARAFVQLAEARRSGTGVLVLDEPTAHLDLRHQEHLLTQVVDWAASGLAVCVVLHDLNQAARVADDVILLEAGRVRASGGAADVLRADLLSEVYGVPLSFHIGSDGTTFWIPTGSGGRGGSKGEPSILSQSNSTTRSSHDFKYAV